MTTAGAARSTAASTLGVDDDVDDQCAVVVYNCTRLGLVANPPGFSLLDLFKFRRRRR